MTRPRRSVRAAALLALILLSAGPTMAQEELGVGWDLGVVLEGAAGFGDLEAVALTMPAELGPDALLLRDDLLSAATYAPQTTARLRSEVSLRLGAGIPPTWGERPFEARVAAIALLGFEGRPVVAAPGESYLGYRFGAPSWGSPRFVVRAGRLLFADAHAALINQLADGASLAMRFPSVYASLGFGTTALVDEALFTPRALPKDADAYGDSLLRSPTRLLALARVEGALPAGQRIGLAAAWYDDPLAAGSMIWHTDLAAEGRLAALFSLAHRTRVGLRFSPDGTGLAADARLTAGFDPLPLSAVLSIRFASGGESLARYLPLSPAPTGPILAIPATNLVSVGARATVEFARRPAAPVGTPVQAWIAGRVAFTAAGSSWTGSEATLGMELPLLADLSARFLAGVGWTPTGVKDLLRMEGRIEL